MKAFKLKMKCIKLKDMKIKLVEFYQWGKQIYDSKIFQTIRSFGERIYNDKIEIHETNQE